MPEKYSIEETKDLLDFGLTFGSVIGQAAENGFQIGDLLLVVPALMKAPAAIEGIGQVPSELKNISDAEAVELKQFVRDKFDIPGDQLEAVIERALTYVSETASFIFFIRSNVKRK